MSESLRNDGRVWVPKQAGDKRAPRDSRNERDYYLERKYPSFGNLAPATSRRAPPRSQCDAGLGVGPKPARRLPRLPPTPSSADGKHHRSATATSSRCTSEITGETPTKVPMRIYPAPHYTMGGLWVDYNLMSTIPGLHVLGEANFSDHGANRLGASALMQGLADGYFVIPYTIGGITSPGTKRPRSTPTTRNSRRPTPSPRSPRRSS
jgi:succinate dehydrogenase / fumarate reductase flavoprotein subunit